MIYSFFGGEISDTGYVEGNMEYAEEYKEILNDNTTKNLNGYVPLSRLIYFYIEDDSLSLKSIYENNLDYELKTIKTISEVCLESYNSFFVCKDSEISDSNQGDEYPYKPFNAPIKFQDVTITSFFGEERIVFDKYDIHYAWDFAVNAETPVYSVGEGIVKTVRFNQSKNETDQNKGAGNYIEIEYDIDGIEYEVLYGHLYPNSSRVKEGDVVKSWQEIAGVGTTGYATGNHLHFEVSVNGTQIDGMSLIDFNLNEDVH
jgi:murein DD-endopeptidase MepM/ murein hydrolase activator NlpD